MLSAGFIARACRSSFVVLSMRPGQSQSMYLPTLARALCRNRSLQYARFSGMLGARRASLWSRTARHSKASVRLLENVDPTVSVELSIQPPPAHFPERFRHYLNTHPTGKQLALIMSLPTNDPTLYIDSDVLFLPAASDLVALAGDKRVPAYYLADCQFSGDPRLLRNQAEKEESGNTGVLLLFRTARLVLEASIRFLDLEQETQFFHQPNHDPSRHARRTVRGPLTQ